MTITSETTRIEYTASGLSTFAYTWKIFDESDLLVILRTSAGVETTKTLNTHYTVTGVGDDAGGTIVFTSAPTSTDAVVIVLDPALTQELDLTTGAIPASSLETALDKIINVVKRVYDKTTRSLALTDGGETYNASSYRIIEMADPEDDQDAATKAYVDSTVATGALNTTVSAFGATLIDDANATVARATLGSGSIGDAIFAATNTSTVWLALNVNAPISSLLELSSSAADMLSVLGVPSLIPYANPVINADFQVWQFGSSVTNATTVLNNDDTYFCDQWYLLSNGNSVVNLAKTDTTFGYATNCFGLVEITAVTTAKFAIVQPLESAVTVPLRGKTISLSLLAKANSSLRDMRVHLVSWSNATFGTPDVLTSDVVSAWNGATTKPTAIAGVTLVDSDEGSTFTASTSSWIQNTFTFTVPSDAQNLGIFIGSNDASYAAGDKIAFSGVQINEAGLSVPFRSKPFAQELALCERFYTKTFPYATAPVDNATATGAIRAIINAQGTGNPAAATYWSFRQRMVNTPTITAYNPTGGTGSWIYTSNATVVTATTAGASPTGVYVSSATVASGATGVLHIHLAADARL